MAARKQPSGTVRESDNKEPLWRSPLTLSILLAQVLSVLLCVMGTTSGLLASRGINMPTTQGVLNYLLLGLTCGAYHLRVRGPRLTNPWFVYLLLAVLDVEANFIVVKAYQYTSVTSVTLMDCFTIPAVMALSALFLRARFRPTHFAGAALCVGGLAVLVATDGASETGGPNPLLGDALVLLGAMLYACSNVAQERLLLSATPVSELLAAVGTFGALFGGLQATLLERSAWFAADWSDPWFVAAPLLGFALALYSFSLLLPRVLMWSGATVLNLSLLTSDVWAAGARVVFFGGFGGTAGWFVLSLVCEAAGLVLYAWAGETHPHPQNAGDPKGERRHRGIFAPLPVADEEEAGLAARGGGRGRAARLARLHEEEDPDSERSEDSLGRIPLLMGVRRPEGLTAGGGTEQDTGTPSGKESGGRRVSFEIESGTPGKEDEGRHAAGCEDGNPGVEPEAEKDRL